MKKLTSVLLIATLATSAAFLGCDPNGGGGGGGGGGGEITHTWKANYLAVEPEDSKYNSTHNILLSGDYSVTDFKIFARDSYYSSYEYADFYGYGEKWNEEFQSETSVTVNDASCSDGTFTIETGKKYSIKFTYSGLTATLTVTGNEVGGIVPSSETLSAINGTVFSDVVKSDALSFQMLVQDIYSGDGFYPKTTNVYNLADTDYSIFTGADEDSLSKLSGNINDYVFKTSDKVMKIYHKADLTSASTTIPAYTLNMTVSDMSSISNVVIPYLEGVTQGTEIKLLDIFDLDSSSNSKVTAYDSDDNELGRIRFLNTDGTVKENFTLEIYDNMEFSGTPAATITSATTEDDTWTPGTGCAYKNYNYRKINDDETWSYSSTSYYYFVKIIYSDGAVSFKNSVKTNTVTAGDHVTISDGSTQITMLSGDNTTIRVEQKSN